MQLFDNRLHGPSGARKVGRPPSLSSCWSRRTWRVGTPRRRRWANTVVRLTWYRSASSFTVCKRCSSILDPPLCSAASLTCKYE